MKEEVLKLRVPLDWTNSVFRKNERVEDFLKHIKGFLFP